MTDSQTVKRARKIVLRGDEVAFQKTSNMLRTVIEFRREVARDVSKAAKGLRQNENSLVGKIIKSPKPWC
jgi:hypothetical protein